ncbi:unnamed protein product [Phytomonas sp. Hart1]|nr:unnamed protein product [Phytomonas sp. Hart1]|eukprot:CCW70953.1 unnamed protein product [Phytomonas sp. isolate Hart1]
MKNSVARVQQTKTFNYIPKDNNIPLIFGTNFHDDPINRNTLRKSHNLLLPKKENEAPHTEYYYSDSKKIRDPNTLLSDEAQEVSDGLETNKFSNTDHNSFVVQLLAYFVENIQQNPTDEKHIRKVCIKFFMEDDSISIIELKEANSGIVQGTILSRRQVPKKSDDDKKLVLLKDLKIGNEVLIYGINYHIIDMDRGSRCFFKEILHENVPEPLDFPLSSTCFLPHQKNNPSRTFTSDDMDRKRVIEQQLTGIYSKRSNEDILITQQFLKNGINEHLSYLALWDDRGSISGDLHFCVIRLFLENFSVEVMEQRRENSTCSGGKVLISRQRISKPGCDIAKSKFQEHTFGKLMKNDYLEPQDLKISETYIIFGKPFFIYGCDNKTREYMKANFDIDLSSNVDITPFMTEKKPEILFYPPPPNGFGSDWGQRNNWLTLNGNPLKQDLGTMNPESGRVLIFMARLANPLVKGDERREFAIVFHCDTKELCINEKSQRNSGFLGGRFLAKGAHRKELANGITVPFEADDFVIGKCITIYKRNFLLSGITEGTKQVLEGKDELTTEDKIKNLISLFKHQMKLKFTKAREAYLALAPQGIFGYKQIKDFLYTCSCNISDEESIFIAQNLFPDGANILSFDTFLKMFSEISRSVDDFPFAAHYTGNVNMSINESQKESIWKSESDYRCSHLKEFLKEKLTQRKGVIQQQFRLFSEYSLNSRLSRESFRRTLRGIIHSGMDKADEDMLVHMLFDGVEDDNNEITYKQFQEFLE